MKFVSSLRFVFLINVFSKAINSIYILVLKQLIDSSFKFYFPSPVYKHLLRDLTDCMCVSMHVYEQV